MEFDSNFIYYLLSTVLTGLYTGVLGAIEILSLGSVDRSSEEDDTPGGFAARLLDDPIRGGVMLATGRFVTAVVVIVTATRWVIANADGAPLGAGTAVALILVVSLIVPGALCKSLALRDPHRFLTVTRPLTVATLFLMRPFAALLRATGARVSPALVNLIGFQLIPLREKLALLGRSNDRETDEERRIMSSVLAFGETSVREVMVPRIDIVAVNTGMDRDEAVETIVAAGHSRIPLYEETIDKIIGTVYTKDLLRCLANDEDFSLRDIMREAFFIPESKMIDDLLAEFRARRQHLAVVVDEYGGTAGIVTLEDVLEELVGDIQDEFDEEEALIERIDDSTVICNAKIRVDDLNDALGLKLSDEHGESLGGLLYHELGHVPRSGDRWDYAGVSFEIQSVVRQRIENVLITGLGARDVTLEDKAG